MNVQIVGTLFQSYAQYCDWMDQALASLRAPLFNGLPMAADARRLIEQKRLSYVKSADHALVFSAFDGYIKLYYAAEETATLLIPPVKLSVIADQVRVDGKPYPKYDALMRRSLFSLARVKASMDRKLDEDLKPMRYFRAEQLKGVSVQVAMPGECYKINTLLRNIFDPLLDELPARDELIRGIRDGNVFVIRDLEKIAAVMVRVTRGYSAMLYWVAVDPAYRNLKLSGYLHYAGDLDSRRHGYRHVLFWVDVRAEGWIRTLEGRGYRLSNQRLYTYVRKL